jgi:hypothetical protein
MTALQPRYSKEELLGAGLRSTNNRFVHRLKKATKEGLLLSISKLARSRWLRVR